MSSIGDGGGGGGEIFFIACYVLDLIISVVLAHGQGNRRCACLAQAAFVTPFALQSSQHACMQTNCVAKSRCMATHNIVALQNVSAANQAIILCHKWGVVLESGLYQTENNTFVGCTN